MALMNVYRDCMPSRQVLRGLDLALYPSRGSPLPRTRFTTSAVLALAVRHIRVPEF